MHTTPKRANDPHWLTNATNNGPSRGRSDSADFERDPGHTQVFNATMHHADLGKGMEEIEQLMKDKVYDVIQAYQHEIGAMLSEAELHHTKRVLRKFLPSLTDDQCEKFHKSISDGNVCYYKEALLTRYRPAVQNKFAEMSSRSPEMQTKLEAIKKKIYNYLLQKNWEIEDLFRVLDKDDSKGISVDEFAAGTKAFLSQEEAITLFTATDKRSVKEIDLLALKSELI